MPPSPTGGGWSVFLVNSGSEANDLAFQIARDATQRQGIVVLEVVFPRRVSSPFLCSTPRRRLLFGPC